jgi:hypothetical protein
VEVAVAVVEVEAAAVEAAVAGSAGGNNERGMIPRIMPLFMSAGWSVSQGG